MASATGSSNAFTCSELNQYLFPWSVQGNAPLNVLQPVLDALPSLNNLDFVAMSETLNQAKGLFFKSGFKYIKFTNDKNFMMPMSGAGWVWPTTNERRIYSAFDTLGRVLHHLERVLYGVLEIKTDNMLDLMDRTNSRIYAAWSVCVNIISCEFIANDSQAKYRQ